MTNTRVRRTSVASPPRTMTPIIEATSETQQSDPSSREAIVELRAELATVKEHIAHLESLAHTDHTLSAEVIEQITTTAVTKMVTHCSTLLKMGDILLYK